MGPYDHLDDPAERAWLTNVSPTDVLRNAHRIYDFMREGGMPPDSYTRELAFEKAAAALDIPYDVLYDAWLDEQPVAEDEMQAVLAAMPSVDLADLARQTRKD